MVGVMAIDFRGAKTPDGVSPHEPESDEQARAVSAALRADAGLVSCKVRCEVEKGVATLYGQVPTHYLKQLAQETVRRSGGIDRVVNQIVVRAPKSESTF